MRSWLVVQLLKSWEYKNTRFWAKRGGKLYSYLNLESTKTYHPASRLLKSLYSYLNLESTKTSKMACICGFMLYSYLNLESTKTDVIKLVFCFMLYSYLNLESTKTSNEILTFLYPHSDYKINNCPCQFLLSKNLCNSSSSGVCEYLIR